MSNMLNERRAYGMQNVLVILDIGNGDVKSLARVGNSTTWVKSNFPSVIAEDVSGGFIVDGRKVIVGADASALRCGATGANDQGKINNALPLLINVLKEVVGFDKPLTVDVIFTCPSVKEYSERIQKKIKGTHNVLIEADHLNNTKEVKQTIKVASVVGQLEGHHASRTLKLKAGVDNYIVDIGNRTVIATCVNEDGGILHRYRKIFNTCGVQSIANKISVAEGVLTGLPNAPMIANPQTIINYLIDTKFSKEDATAAWNQTSPYIGACLDEVVDWVHTWISEQPSQKHVVHFIGGGAKLPGIKNLFGKCSTIAKNPSWSTVNGISQIADTLLGGAK